MKNYRKRIIEIDGDKNMKQIYKILSVFVILIFASVTIANAKELISTDLSINQYDDCRSCHIRGLTMDMHHFLVTNLGKYTCPDCHPIVSGGIVIERDCKNCHNGTAFWANPNLNPGAPLHIPASITVISPTSGNSWKIGTTQTIKWNYTGNPGPNVTIDLLKGGVLDQTLISSISKGTYGNGSYNWSILKSIAIGNDYQIKIKSMVSTTNNTYIGTSNNFGISRKNK